MDRTFSVPANESARLDAVTRLGIVGTPPAADFDAILAVALQVTGCEAGTIGLIERDRHWFKAESGIGCAEVPRQASLCNYTLLQTNPLIVEDLTRDPRFHENPFVINKGARFYAGISLVVAGGFNVGTLCVTDSSPRQASDELAATLRHLGRVIEGLLDAHALASGALVLAQKAEARERDVWRKTRLIAQSERLAKIGAWEFDVEANSFFMSDECYRINGLEIGSAVDLDELRSRREPGHRERSSALMKTCLETGQGYEVNGEIVTALGNPRWVQMVVEAEKQDGKIVRVFGTLRDRTAERETERTLWRAAHYDTLTQAPNRHYWTQRLEQAFAAAESDCSALTVLILDLDGFKEINDTRGHAVGDGVLREVARRLAAGLPDASFHARLGGDEFAILLLDETSKGEIQGIARGLLGAIREPIVVDGLRLHVSGTLGFACFPVDAMTAGDLMQKADIALYQAKRSHRNSFAAFRSAGGGFFDDKRRAIDRVAIAIEQNRLVPFYQRKIDLGTGRLIGFEALCRIEMDDGGILVPGQFVEALADPASAARIGATMLECVTADLAAWRDAGFSYGSVAINVTGADFAEGDLGERIRDRLRALSLDPSTLEVEVTENTILGKEALVVGATLHSLRDQGISIALDDFGTGYASLSHLRDAPIDCIKLDRSFIEGLGRHADSTIIVKSMVDLGHGLGKRLVAEGIETRGQAEFLRAIGCDEAQGFLFGHPESRSATTALLERQKPCVRASVARSRRKGP